MPLSLSQTSATKTLRSSNRSTCVVRVKPRSLVYVSSRRIIRL